MGIGGMYGRLDFCGVVEKQVENIVAFMFISTDDSGTDRNMVGNQSVGDNSLL